MLLLCIGGCDLLAGPAHRAREFIEALVAAEPATQPDFADGLGARVALDYLRALHRQGIALEYGVAGTKRNGEKTVVRLLIEPPSGAEIAPDGSAPTTLRVSVELLRTGNGEWRVVRWWADD